MGKREKKGTKEKVQKDAQNNETEDSKDGILGLAAPKRPKKAKDNLLRIEDISRHSSSSGKLGPILHSDIFL